jgi:hypothetical protein
VTGKDRVLSAASLSGSLVVALVLAYFFLRTQPIVAAILVIVMVWGALWATRRLQGTPPAQFHSRGLLFGLGASLGFMGVAFPHGPDLAVFGLMRASVAWQVLGIITYFIVGTIGATVGAWIAANVKVSHTPKSNA